jgi:hypothetical protein
MISEYEPLFQRKVTGKPCIVIAEFHRRDGDFGDNDETIVSDK